MVELSSFVGIGHDCTFGTAEETEVGDVNGDIFMGCGWRRNLGNADRFGKTRALL
jgi:hypothetical protein